MTNSTNVYKCTEKENGTFTITLEFTQTREDAILGSISDTTRFYFNSEKSIEKGTELPKFNPENYKIKEVPYEFTDENTGEIKSGTNKWITL